MVAGETPFAYNKQTYSIKRKLFSVFDIDIYSDKDTINSRMELFLIENDNDDLVECRASKQ
jgi:hypothetical protein